jgi:hypothetical protein
MSPQSSASLSEERSSSMLVSIGSRQKLMNPAKI